MGVVTKERVELPNDVEALKAMVAERDTLLAERDTLLAERDAEIAHLAHRVDVLTRMAFEPNSERRPAAPLTDQANQTWLLFPELVELAERVADETAQRGTIELKAPAKPKKKGGRRKKYPAHLPTVRTTYELPEDQRTCTCGHALHEIGEEVTRELERLELMIVHEIARMKYACRACTDGVKIALGPPRVIGKGQLGVGFLANVLTERFANHMPYNRLERKYASEGLDLSRSVLWRSSHRCAERLWPIYRELERQTLASFALHTDDTTAPLKESKTGGRKLARIWVYRDLEGRQVFDFTESRSRDGPARLLGDYTGYVIADAYPGYDAFFGPGKATEVACWAHTRRYFVRAETTDPKLADEAIARIKELYEVERAAKRAELDPLAVLELRRSRSVPLLARLQEWLIVKRMEVLDKSPMAKAIDYALGNWKALSRYCEDGRLPIDNNAAERSLRAVAVGRKNWNFIGN